MSADLFAAFEDVPSPPPSKGQPPKNTGQTSSTSDPFSFGISNAINASRQTGNQTNPLAQQWNNNPQLTPKGGQLERPSDISGWTSTSLQPIQQKVPEDEDDGWGDFEVAPAAGQPPAPPATNVKEPQNPGLQRTRPVRASTIDLMTNNLLDIGNLPPVQNESKSPSWTQAPSKQAQLPRVNAAPQRAPKKTFNSNPNVLFDADDFDGDQENDDDDFGEFETVASPVQTAPDLLSSSIHPSPVTTETRASQMLAGLNITEPASYPQAPRSPYFQDRNPFPGLAVAPPPKTEEPSPNEPKTSPVTAWPSLAPKASAESDRFGDEWDAFDSIPEEQMKSDTNETDSNWDWDLEEPVQPKPKHTPAPATAPKPQDASWDWDPVDEKTDEQVDQPKDGLPPINVPPPSILLSVFPQLFDQANTSLYKPVSGQSFSVKNRILSDPKTIEFLKGYLSLATVAAHVIAGRKLRWHRDKFLAKGMSISAAGSKGMKLAGVDKAQTAREDREAADVVANWKEHIGRLRSVVVTANSSMKNNAEQLKIPELSESMPIQTEKLVPTAPKACIVCGLKRNERVSKVDHEVEDSFGEWWVDHWGHLACKRFWLQHENTLRQR
ncbi:hypothetical protein F4819DRAFT_6872 [Hypoxylon fuscum]|nr:hypothetical protein F4819DRAFT_6872 [Hypoxylon fuscum]